MLIKPDNGAARWLRVQLGVEINVREFIAALNLCVDEKQQFMTFDLGSA